MSGSSVMRGVLGTLGRLVEGAWNAANPYPPEWSNRTRLCAWEQQHLDPRSGIWALRCSDGDLELYHPGSPAPRQWPDGDDPYHLVKPVAVTVEPDIFMPYPPQIMAALVRWVEQVSGQYVLQHEAGIRWADGGRWGEPIIYLACTR